MGDNSSVPKCWTLSLILAYVYGRVCRSLQYGCCRHCEWAIMKATCAAWTGLLRTSSAITCLLTSCAISPSSFTVPNCLLPLTDSSARGRMHRSEKESSGAAAGRLIPHLQVVSAATDGYLCKRPCVRDRQTRHSALRWMWGRRGPRAGVPGLTRPRAGQLEEAPYQIPPCVLLHPIIP